MSVTQENIKKELSKVQHPDLKKDIVSLGMVAEIEISAEKLNIKLKTPTEDRRLQIGLEAQIRQTLSKVGVGKIKIKFEHDPNMVIEDSRKPQGIKRVVAIGSGKGGVGKSSVTVNLASAMANKGLKVGVLDADIYGPSVGKMFGVNGRVMLKTDENSIWPLEKYGIKVISFSFLIQENQPVIWRGPMLGKAVEQFLYDVVWEELDYLLIDLPPGTGDVQLSLAQLIDVDGGIIVTTPQEVATFDASRAGAMFAQLKIPVLGVVENMSEFICPHCGKGTPIFSSGGGNKLSDILQAPLLGSIPLTVDMMRSGESGQPLVMADKDGKIAQAFSGIHSKMEEEILKYLD
ncbi:MAG: Mrp/NBP35 family ATP-binding protein [Leptospiraceae bacterium]|nr:Mrp/NBP35 family ATP-binding protein [Leptospiraceae bacterium]MCP5496566.1 Mrp/NBP35 family ATP-binding protein [Leptospiraceae bacterium]